MVMLNFNSFLKYTIHTQFIEFIATRHEYIIVCNAWGVSLHSINEFVNSPETNYCKNLNIQSYFTYNDTAL